MIALLFAMLAAMLLFPDVCIASAENALRVWALDVVPSLFPYMVLSRLLAARLSKRSIPAAISVPILGLMGGSPSGASVLAVCAQEGKLSSRALHTLAALCGTISPMFFLGTIARWTGDTVLARRLLIAHLIGACYAAAVVLIIKSLYPDSAVRPGSASRQSSENSITQSIDAVLGVGGCILFFSVLAALISHFLPASFGILRPILHAALETAGGTHALLSAELSANPRAVLCAALCAFSGFSILTQNLLFLRPLGITMPQLLLYAILRALGAGTAMSLLIA